ncbi:hypothetical protein OrNV_gp085 [Oryctes rhinoceros nudivirus]|uniref:Uncharacterized protein n=1 Tax=Oryctes rhinoceros nudivirus TaxID=92521 RepID=A0A6B9QUB2_9VIRU|nr:hypothetical protein OrNV_gp085 [Oryctes rhinoceros nudivirus]ACH96215.1 unknown [Oryctes rhinoceros nudivirus]QHG11318.1 hypothetical protein SI_OrNV_gp085 [Oryctes rhinoceros nudivirus]QKE59549.1 hypothetical protein SI_OrNV_gp085 [Oryctes rhinoceros nudivirus]UBO76496.1 hypothetical protein SI_OrNV_gp085 [Oryctes rhinoceros nudivirus]WAQ80084.1 hypothetical protein LK20_00080 [Oryctes rhinoceros nudivirus]
MKAHVSNSTYPSTICGTTHTYIYIRTYPHLSINRYAFLTRIYYEIWRARRFLQSINKS